MPILSWSRVRRAGATVLLATLAWGGVAAAQTLSLKLIAAGLTNPVALANAGDGSNRLFIVDQTGVIRIYSGGQVLPAASLDITSTVITSGEQGLLRLAFDPSFAHNGVFYGS